MPAWAWILIGAVAGGLAMYGWFVWYFRDFGR